jgi:GNAT superfamily N-acetyltransferase
MTPSDTTSATGEEVGRRALTLRFDEFGWERLESEARRDGAGLDDLLSRAAAYFYAEWPTGRASTLAPGFKPDARGEPREVQLEGDAECWVGLESEARRQGIPVERLLEHAALLYLADSDSGRLAERVLDRADEDDEP